MNDKERIEILAAMLADEREKVSRFLEIADSYARGLHMMANVAYADAPAGTAEEANARTIRQHAMDLAEWLKVRGGELRELMGRAMPAAATGFGLTEAMIEELEAYLPGDPAEGLPEAPEPPAPPLLAEDTERPEGVTIH